MKVPQFMPYIGPEEYEAIKPCFDANWITEGPQSKLFNEELIELMGAKYGVFAPNGTLALYLGLRAMGIGVGDEVIVPDFTFIGSANAVEMCGATPVFVDVNKEDLQISVKDCGRVLNKNTRAIMPVHLFGLAANMGEIMEFATHHDLKVIEDAAQAVGVKWRGQHCGTFGDVGCFSFFADKTITTGEGGFVTTNDEKIYEKLLFLRNQGRLNRGSFIHPEIGYNFRITDIQAAMGRVQLQKLPEIIRRKVHLLNLYKDRLRAVKEVSIVIPKADSNHIPFRVVLMCEDLSQSLMDFLAEKDVETRTVFYPLHKQECYKDLYPTPPKGAFKSSIHAYDHGVCLPSYPELEEAHVDYICDLIKDYYHV
jgi:perosamine synthetase